MQKPGQSTLSQNLPARLQQIAAVLIFVVIIFIYILISHSRNRVWSNDYVFWQDVTSKSPSKCR